MVDKTHFIKVIDKLNTEIRSAHDLFDPDDIEYLKENGGLNNENAVWGKVFTHYDYTTFTRQYVIATDLNCCQRGEIRMTEYFKEFYIWVYDFYLGNQKELNNILKIKCGSRYELIKLLFISIARCFIDIDRRIANGSSSEITSSSFGFDLSSPSL